MWKSIKKFSKWIANHTGISWILRNFPSSQRSDNKGSQAKSTSQQVSSLPDHRVSNLLQDQDKPGVFDVIKKGDSRDLVLHVAKNSISKILSDIDHKNLSEYHVYIECKKGVFKVILKAGICNSNAFYTSFNVCSIAPYDHHILYSELKDMRNVLGLSEGGSPVVITHISKDPITVPKTVEDGNTPSPDMTNSETLAVNGNQHVHSE
ncbi:hypothetical protein [Wolbachia endosymbiont of Ctenocephalides felis wCfeJ]|uniref:hypothetical protein n=1 Tax=Wolbachia endosymbiont of Ctenocephalides felis wCfeJ TaxID=2732594 RepID=UPI0014460E42|nr:hypothetical protein [Wolbachia endosymbiont of Ctenocephalides felis wCfeJ]WCR58354.1 MAG: hypothetical protein PG980_000826 [Wolbachia endosymbiont of Ctenocephalides felis wCfeJ]